MTQFAGPHVDEIGLIKFDFLGLKTLTLVHNVVRRIRDGRGGRRSIVGTLPLDDKKTYRLIAKGDTVGVFQMESGGMRKLVTQLRPSDVRGHHRRRWRSSGPGPLDSGMVEQFIKRKHGKEEVKYPHPKLEPILEPTYGVIVYQEQVMQIAQVLAGYTPRRRRQSAPRHGQEEPGEDEEGARALHRRRRPSRGIAEKQAGEIFDQMETFAIYGFNKSHSAAYALVSFQTAYLKAHYPEEFMAGLLSHGDGRHRQDVQEHRRVPRARHPHPAAGRQREPRGLHRAGAGRRQWPAADPLRPRAPCAASAARRSRPSSPRATADGPFTSLADFCKRVLASYGTAAAERGIRAEARGAVRSTGNRAGARAGQQEGHRIADQVRRLRLRSAPTAASSSTALDKALAVGRRRTPREDSQPDRPLRRQGHHRRRAGADAAGGRRRGPTRNA